MHIPWTPQATVSLIALLAVLAIPTLASATDTLQESPDRAMVNSSIGAARALKQQRKAVSKQKNSGTAKLGRFIKSMVDRHNDRTTSKHHPLESNPFLQVKDGNTVQVYVTIADAGETNLRSLEDQGLIIELVNTGLKKVQGWLRCC